MAIYHGRNRQADDRHGLSDVRRLIANVGQKNGDDRGQVQTRRGTCLILHSRWWSNYKDRIGAHAISGPTFLW